MGLFGKDKRSDAERTEDAMQQAEKIVGGKGLTGKLAKGFMGADTMAKFGEGLETARNAQADAAIAASGIPGVPAKVTALSDTGQLINYDPVVNLTATLESGQVIEMQTLVSKLQIPRVGDSINLIPNPSQPGTYVYGGLAL